jgi:hypothetical protein
VLRARLSDGGVFDLSPAQHRSIDEERSKCLRWVVRCLTFSEAEIVAMADTERELVRAVRAGALRKRQMAHSMGPGGKAGSSGEASGSGGPPPLALPAAAASKAKPKAKKGKAAA